MFVYIRLALVLLALPVAQAEEYFVGTLAFKAGTKSAVYPLTYRITVEEGQPVHYVGTPIEMRKDLGHEFRFAYVGPGAAREEGTNAKKPYSTGTVEQIDTPAWRRWRVKRKIISCPPNAPGCDFTETIVFVRQGPQMVMDLVRSDKGRPVFQLKGKLALTTLDAYSKLHGRFDGQPPQGGK